MVADARSWAPLGGDHQAREAEILRQLDRHAGEPPLHPQPALPKLSAFHREEELDGLAINSRSEQSGLRSSAETPDYDTTSDPIVRVTAAEIRKRIAQYYQDSGHVDEFRISLPPGSYVPHFDWPRNSSASSCRAVSIPVRRTPLNPAVPEQPSAVSIPPARVPRARGYSSRSRWRCLVLLADVGMMFARPRQSSLDRFWAPVFSSGDTVVVCFPRDALRRNNSPRCREPRATDTS